MLDFVMKIKTVNKIKIYGILFHSCSFVALKQKTYIFIYTKSLMYNSD